MRRRDFILALGGAAIAPSLSSSLTALAQQPERMRRIGILMNLSETDPEAQALVAAFLQELERLGWSGGRNARFEMRWTAGNPERIRRYAVELAALAPDVLLGYAGSVVRPLQQVTQTVPIVFAGAIDPVAAGLVASLAKPGGNTTGFMQLEYTVSGKWLDLLKDVAPGVTRVGVLRNLSSPGAGGQWTALETAAPTFGIALSPLDVSDGGDIERVIATFARGSNDGLIILLSPLAAVHRDLIIALAARHRLPAVYPYRYFAGAGGLISYGPVLVDSFRRAAGYEPQDSESTGPHHPRQIARPRRRGDRVKRRDFIVAFGSAAATAWSPLATRAQQRTMPVLGFLSSVAEEAYILAAVRRGLSEQGFVEGRNLQIEYRYARGHYDHLPTLAAELVSLPVAAIVALPSSPAALATKAATAKIPIIFALGVDPVALGLVASYNLPGGNVTGVSVIPTSLAPKRLGLLDQLLPKSTAVALLINPTNRPPAAELQQAGEAARALGRELVVLEAGNEGEIDAAFETLVQRRIAGLAVWQEAFLASRRQQIVALAQRHRLPTIYATRQFAEIGGLISYGSNPAESYRQVGIYAGKILKGARPADLPVMQPAIFELVLNLGTAKSLALAIPPTLLALADEVIE